MDTYLTWLSRPDIDERAMRSAERVLTTFFQQKSRNHPVSDAESEDSDE